MKQALPFWPLIIALAILKFILPFILQSPVYELQRDEYLYYEQGRHLNWGYLENPPLISYLGMISYWFGDSVFSIKFWPSLFGALTLILSCLLTVEFGGKRYAQFLVGLGIITGAFLRVHSLFQPNILDIFFWTLAVYCIIRYINSNKTQWLYLFCISLSLGFWSKYSVVFIAASLILSLLMSQHRKIYKENKFYLAALLGLIVILPNVWWQYNHNWPLVRHMEELQETQLQFLNPADFIKDQFLFLFPALFVWITGLVWLFKNKQWRFLFVTYFLVIILLIVGRGKSYYSLGVYPMLLAAGARSLESWSLPRQWLRYAMTLVVIFLTLPFIPLLLPVWQPDKLAAFYKKHGVEKTGLLKWEDQVNHPLPQDFADMLGWKELAIKTELFFNNVTEPGETNTIVYCRNYGQAGSLRFFGRGKTFFHSIISDNGSFLLWIPNGQDFKNILFVGEEMPGKDDEVFQHFEKVTIVDSVTNKFSRQYGDKIIFFENIDSTGLRLAKEGIREMKKEFHR